MRILFLTKYDLARGSVVEVFRALGVALAPLGVEVCLYSNGASARQERAAGELPSACGPLPRPGRFSLTGSPSHGFMLIPQVMLDAYNFKPGAIGQLSIRLNADASLPDYDTDGDGVLDGQGYTEELILTIPEPATMSLLALGGLALIRRRRN
jgi:hypothetical protein